MFNYKKTVLTVCYLAVTTGSIHTKPVEAQDHQDEGGNPKYVVHPDHEINLDAVISTATELMPVMYPHADLAEHSAKAVTKILQECIGLTGKANTDVWVGTQKLCALIEAAVGGRQNIDSNLYVASSTWNADPGAISAVLARGPARNGTRMRSTTPPAPEYNNTA